MTKSAIILAGGEGKRMKSDKPKTLSLVLGKPMLSWVLSAVRGAGIETCCVVTGFGREYVEEYLSEFDCEVSTAYQSQRLGTGHAVMMCEDFLKNNPGDTLVLNGDSPFMDCATIEKAYSLYKEKGAGACVISARLDNPFGYGRVVRDSAGSVACVVEQKDATQRQAAIDEVNSGCYWFDTEALLSALGGLTRDNAGGEYYLTDVVAGMLREGKSVCAYTAESPDIVLGANTPEQLLELNETARVRFAKS